MPRTRSVLSDRHRIHFGEWLDEIRQLRGLSKKALAKALGRPGGATNRHVNAYLSGAIPASESTLIALARALELPERYILLAGGYFEPLIDDIEDLVAIGRWYCDLDGFSFRDCMEGRPIDVAARHVGPAASAPYMQIRVASGRGAQSYTVPAPTVAAVHIALLAFPRRGERYKDDELPGIFQSFDPRGYRRPPGKMPRELSDAIRGLRDTRLPSDSRRAIAGEYVRAWITHECGSFARDLALFMYDPAFVPSVPNVRVELAPTRPAREQSDLSGIDEENAVPLAAKHRKKAAR